MTIKQNPYFKLLFLSVCIGMGTKSLAQTITGPTPVGLSTSYTYSYTDGSLIQGVIWTAIKGTIGSTWSLGTTYYASVNWTATGSGSVSLSGTDGLLGTKSVTINSCTTVTAPTATNGSGCGTGTVALSTSAPGSGYSIRWYDNTTNSIILATGQNFTTPSISVTTTYKATKYSTTTGCESSKITVTATVKTVPTVTASAQSICSGTATSIILTNNVASTLNTWTVTQAAASGATGGNGTSGSSSPYTYTLVQTLTATASYNGTVTYTITPSVNGCPGTAVQVIATVVDKFKCQNLNYIISNVILVDNITDTAAVNSLAVTDKSQTIQYMDGLGRPIQSVSWQGSPALTDMVQPVVYDAFGREKKKYLPFVAQNNGLYKSNVIDANGSYAGAALNFYNNTSDKIADDTHPFSETRLESSPLNRTLEQGSPGAAWQPDAIDSYASNTDRAVKMAYEFNGINEVKVWLFTKATSTTPVRLVSTEYYSANQLYKTKTKDEQFNEVIEFKDKSGKVVLKKVQAPNSAWAETYYIYDKFDHLVIVLPPEGVKAFSN